MSYKEYKVKVYHNGDVFWYNEEGGFHREDGPAIYNERTGYKAFYLNGLFCTEEEYWESLKPTKELTIKELEEKLGYKIKVVKEKQ